MNRSISSILFGICLLLTAATVHSAENSAHEHTVSGVIANTDYTNRLIYFKGLPAPYYVAKDLRATTQKGTALYDPIMLLPNSTVRYTWKRANNRNEIIWIQLTEETQTIPE